MTTPAKLFGKNLSDYDEVDVDELLAQLSAEEIKILAKEVDPDVRLMSHRHTTTEQRASFFPPSLNIFLVDFCEFLGQFLAAKSTQQLRLRERGYGTAE